MQDRGDILDTAKQYITKDRAEAHGDLETNFATIAAYWSAHLETPVTSTDVAIMMGLVKIARLKFKPNNMDNWIDGCGYLACGAEIVGVNNAKPGPCYQQKAATDISV
jgi:hypothetical protein